MQEESSQERIIGGRYALHGPIAAGDVASVYIGRLLGVGSFARTVAIKRLKGELLDSQELLATLFDEARLASRIRHPNVVATRDMVVADDEVFLVTEFVLGESLSRLLASAREHQLQLEPRLAAAILVGVLHGLHAAHEAIDDSGNALEIIHRDMAPHNVLIGVDGLARVVDFGIAKGKGRLYAARAGQLHGKVGYMAPEQILGEEPDRRSDVYSAAVVLWELLTGQRLFPTSDRPGADFDIIPKILEADIEPPSVAVADLPQPLNGIVMRGLNRERDARYATAREFAIALEDSVGIATPRQVGDWVSDVAGDTIADRRALLREVDALAHRGNASGKLDRAVVARRRRQQIKAFGDARNAAGGTDDGDSEERQPDSDAVQTVRTGDHSPQRDSGAGIKGSALKQRIATDREELLEQARIEARAVTAERERERGEGAEEPVDSGAREADTIDDRGQNADAQRVVREAVARRAAEHAAAGAPHEAAVPGKITLSSAKEGESAPAPGSGSLPRPNDYLPWSDRPIPSEAPTNLGTSAVYLPVSSNRKLVITVLLVALVVALAAIAAKLFL